MKRTIIIISASLAVLGTLAATRLTIRELTRSSRQTRFELAMSRYRASLDSLDGSLARLDATLAAAGDAVASPPVRESFRDARRAYKHVELFAEYYAAQVAREMNGPALPRTDEEDPDTPIPPLGFQVLEPMVFGAVAPDSSTRMRAMVAALRANARELARRGADTIPGNEYLFDAMRMEISRVAALGIAGFDASVSGEAIAEGAHALEGVRRALSPFRDELLATRDSSLRVLDNRFDDAIAYLRDHPDFERFDRLTFISRHARPLARALTDVQHALKIGVPRHPRAWSARSSSIYDSNAVDPLFFAPHGTAPATPRMVELGRDLFFDPRLSPSHTRSCASCHVSSKAFADDRRRAPLLSGHGGLARNTPTLVNAALQPTMFDDARARHLEDQIADVLGSAAEMGGTLSSATAAVAANARYVARFDSVFGGAVSGSVSPQTVRQALAAFVRSLTAMHSRFDRAVLGDSLALTADERRGFDVFMGKARCGTCHFAPLFHGATPPSLIESEPEVIGVPARKSMRAAEVDEDPGFYGVQRILQNRHAFKTPTLRNIALTAPYMHNGVFDTLEEVVDFYDAGGGAGIGVHLPNQTLAPDSLHLTPAEKRALTAFLRALTDTSYTTRR